MIWHRSSDAREVLGEGRLNERDELSNHTSTLAAPRKGEEREGREEGTQFNN